MSGQMAQIPNLTKVQTEVIRWEEDYTQQGRRRIAKGSPGGRILALFEEY
ncbi:hypothetical protein C5S32_09315 [ANME-1 cluster archaeon GoMg1]|nr:hypothetical protein [ANME-1 cluster archaeon GoMg1]